MDKKSTTPITDEADRLSRDLYAFMAHALKPEIYQRKGQRFMNCLQIYRPDLATSFLNLVHTDPEVRRAAGLDDSLRDPFYVDEALPVAIAWVRDNWNKTREKSGGE